MILHRLHSKWHPFDKVFFIVTSPLWLAGYWLWTTWCRQHGGHEWENDWGGNGSPTPNTIREYDNCQHCPAQRSREPPEELVEE